MPIVDFKTSLVLSDVIATELSELPIVLLYEKCGI